MTVGQVSAAAVKSGLCPHGLAAGACPVCSAMGTNSTKVKTADFSAKPGEMSWNECAAIGAFLKSLKNARLARDNDYQQRLLSIAKFEANLQKAAQQLSELILIMSKNNLTKPLAFAAQKLVLPLMQTFKNMPANVISAMNVFSEKLADISDKLTAIYGELKTAINKKISDLAKKIKKKLFSLFEIFNTENETDENEIMEAFHKKLNKLKDMLKKVTEWRNYDKRQRK